MRAALVLLAGLIARGAGAQHVLALEPNLGLGAVPTQLAGDGCGRSGAGAQVAVAGRLRLAPFLAAELTTGVFVPGSRDQCAYATGSGASFDAYDGQGENGMFNTLRLSTGIQAGGVALRAGRTAP